jgi:hypothetical protein
MGFAEMEAENGEYIDASVHARDDGQVPARAGVGHICTSRGVSLVGVEQAHDLRHGG